MCRCSPLSFVSVPLHDWRAKLTFEENTEILVAPIEARTLWATGADTIVQC